VSVRKYKNYASGGVKATVIQAAESRKVCITRESNVAGIERGPIVKLGINNDVRFVVPSAGEEVSSFFTRIIGKTEIGVAIAGGNFDATKPVN
jgi:hypothetical protein